jgi:hypothetical protein
MYRFTAYSVIVIAVLKLTAAVRAADGPELTPLADPPLMPVPAAEMPLPSMPVGVGFYRPNRRDVWQYYAVDRNGYWRPRVALGWPEPFYLYNGAPFLYLPVRPREYLPYIFD